MHLSTDILVVGSGPSGSLASRQAALSGASVILVDKESFPREKTCGDALSGRAVRFLRENGLADAVLPHAVQVKSVSVTSPNHQTVSSPRDDLYTIPRTRLDAILAEAAQSAGAVFHQQVLVREGVRDPRGLRFRAVCRKTSDDLELFARTAIIATGQPLHFRRHAARIRPMRSLAIRAYFDRYCGDEPSLHVIFDRRLLPGYGWVFPSPEGRANVGVILHTRRHREHVRTAFQAFVTTNPLAVRLLRGARAEAAPSAYPVYTGLGQLPLAEDCLAWVGDAAGAGFPFSGEGMYSAMATGKMAGFHAAQGIRAGAVPQALAGYECDMRSQFLRGFKAARVLELVSRQPCLLNRLVRQGQKHPELSGLYGSILCDGLHLQSIFNGRHLLQMLI